MRRREELGLGGKRRTAARAVKLLAALSLSAAAAAGFAAAPAELKVRWVGTAPDALVLETDGNNVWLSRENGFYSGRTPELTRALHSWPLVARYNNADVKLVLAIRQGSPGIEFELPYPAPGSCHERYVLQTERIPHSRGEALQAMLQAHHLLRLETPNDCLASFRLRLLRARLQRNSDLVRLSGYFDIVPEYRQEYAEAVQAAADRETRLAEVRFIDAQAREVTVQRVYVAQADAQARGDVRAAQSILSDLAARAQADPEWRHAVDAARVDLSRDIRTLSRMSATVADVSAMAPPSAARGPEN